MYALLGHDPNNKAKQADPELRELAALYASAVCGSAKAQAALGAEYEEGMFNGVELKLECSMQKTKPKPGAPAGGDFTAYDWAPAEPN